MLACEARRIDVIGTANNPVTIALQGLADAGPLQWEFTSPEHGSLSGLPTEPVVNAEVTYSLTSPDDQLVREDVFTYELTDDLGQKRASGTVRVFKYRDTDGDGMPDECNLSTETAEACVASGLVSDPDDDNDGIPDEEDAYPLVALGRWGRSSTSNGAPETCDATCLATGMQADKQPVAVDVFVATPKNTAVAVVLEGSDFERDELAYEIREFAEHRHIERCRKCTVVVDRRCIRPGSHLCAGHRLQRPGYLYVPSGRCRMFTGGAYR